MRVTTTPRDAVLLPATSTWLHHDCDDPGAATDSERGGGGLPPLYCAQHGSKEMPLVRLFATAALLSMATGAPPRREYPESWGSPPEMQTSDYRPLPGGYGHGSSTLAMWIDEQMAKEMAKTGQGTPSCQPHLSNVMRLFRVWSFFPGALLS